MKKKLYEIIVSKAELITALSDKVWDYAELSLLEYKSTAAYVEVLKAEGFTVEENLCGIPTAFSGSFGNGSPRIGILGEYIGAIWTQVKNKPLVIEEERINFGENEAK